MNIRKFNIVTKIFLLVILIFLTKGCLENPPAVSTDVNLDMTAKLLQHIESRGDYIHTIEAPSIITAAELFDEVDPLLLDIRTREEFIRGHIAESINIQHSKLLEHILSNPGSNKKIVIISTSGQTAAYYTSLLRLYGINNVYSLKYGMASWNKDFSGIWLGALKESQLLSGFTNEYFDKGKYQDLPKFDYEKNNTVQEVLYNRINMLLNEDFYDDSTAIMNPSVSIDFDLFFNGNTSTDKYFVCIGDKYLYIAPTKGEGPGHPVGTVLFQPNEDTKSIYYLQTLPLDKNIFLYCYDGHLSAYVTAYLRMLGYNARQILFGGNALFYSRMNDPRGPLFSYAFHLSAVADYPYVKGE